MSLLTKYSADVLGWQRKPGPPRVWRVVEGRKNTAEGKNLRFSIQEIPEDRYEEVLELMSTGFLRDEPMSENFVPSYDWFPEMYNDAEAIADFRRLWSFCLQQGIAVGAFVVDENNPKPVLAGVNMIWVVSAAAEEGMKRKIKHTSRNMQIYTKFMSDLEDEINVRQFYKVDEYISGYGLSVHPSYRGHGLANHLLQARDDISALYDIKATSTVFTSPAAQKAAANVGFEILIKRKFVDVRKEDGNEQFPGIRYESFALMGKRFS